MSDDERKTEDWLEGFVKYTSPRPSPELFRLWGGIACLAGALERKVWLNLFGNLKLFPNFYVILVAGPGVGKTATTTACRSFWHFLEEEENFHVSSDSLTKASFIDELEEATRAIYKKSFAETYNSLLVASNELGTLLPEYDRSFMSTLTDLWDGMGYSELRRSTKRKVEIKDPFVNIIAATTPSFLNETLPPGAWDQGFLARTMLIYSGERQKRKLFTGPGQDPKLKQSLSEDLARIANLTGQIGVDEDTTEMLEAWFEVSEDDAPTYPKLLHYNQRRVMHMMKLCMVFSISRSDELVIRQPDFERALKTLLEAERYMPDIFKAMAKNSDAQAIDETWYACFRLYKRHNDTPIPEAKVFNLLTDKTPAHNVMRLIEIMKKSGILKEKTLPKIGKVYYPAAYQERR